MAAFGQADLGLIKATAGAEAGQYMDSNLTIGSAIGGVLKTMQAQQAATQKKNTALQKEIDGKFSMPTGTLDNNLRGLAIDNTTSSITDYANITGTGIQSNSVKQTLVDNTNLYNEQISTTQGNLNYIRSDDFEIPSGATEEMKNFYLHVQNESEVNYFKTSEDGKEQVMMAVPKQTQPQFEIEGTDDYNTYQALEEIEADEDNKLNAQQIIDLGAFRQQGIDYLKWKGTGTGVHTNPDGSYNPDKYIIQNGAGMSVGENMENKANIAKVYNSNVTNVTSSAALNDPRSPSDYAANVTMTLNDKNFDAGGEAMQNIAFNTNLGFESDWDNDGELDSFASVFIGGVNTDKKDLEELMYTNIDKTPIHWKFTDLGFTDDQIAKFDTNGDGKIEWSNDPDSEWQKNLGGNENQETREGMLDFWLRGRDSNGNTNPDKRKKWIKNRYASFMGEVVYDARVAKQRTHFEEKNRYFNTGIAGSDPVFKTAEATEAAKGVTYNKTKFNNAFPKELIGDGINITTTPDGFKKIFPQLRSRFPDCEFYTPNGGKLQVENAAGDKEEFDFEVGNFSTNTKTDVANEYKRLEAFLGNEGFSNDDNVNINGLGTSVDDDNWVKLKNQKYELYPETRVGQKFTTGQYEGFELNGQLIQNQEITITGYDKESGKYTIQTKNSGLSGEIDLVLKQ